MKHLEKLEVLEVLPHKIHDPNYDILNYGWIQGSVEIVMSYCVSIDREEKIYEIYFYHIGGDAHYYRRRYSREALPKRWHDAAIYLELAFECTFEK